jgi:hypothetical protein
MDTLTNGEERMFLSSPKKRERQSPARPHAILRPLLVLLGILAAASCFGGKKAVVGTWFHEDDGTVIELQKDGSIIVTGDDEPRIGNYSFMDDTRIRIDFPGPNQTPVIAVVDERDDSLIVQASVLNPRRLYGAPNHDGAGTYRRAAKGKFAARQDLAGDIQKQKKAMKELRMIARAWEARAVDYNTYSTDEPLTSRGEVGYAALKRILADYIKDLPEQDPWGGRYRFYGTEDGQEYRIVALGSDGQLDPETLPMNERSNTPVRCFEDDIVYQNGAFVRSPKGPQTHCRG